MISVFRFWIALSLTALSLPAASAQTNSDQWKSLDTWDRYSEKELHDQFKTSKPRPVERQVKELELGKPAKAEDPGKSYVILPGSQPQLQPSVAVQTNYVPVVRSAGLIGPGWGYGRTGLWHPGWLGAPGLGFGALAAPGSLALPAQTQVIQSGPSHSSGNYYNEPTWDASASGHYFTSPPGLPKAAPIIHQDGSSGNYWGSSGNPLPSELRN